MLSIVIVVSQRHKFTMQGCKTFRKFNNIFVNQSRRIHRSFVNYIFATANCNDVYGREYIEPSPNPNDHYSNRPTTGDGLFTQQVKPAPTDHTYSNFFNFDLYKLERQFIRRGETLIAKKIVADALENIKAKQVRKYHLATDDEQRESIELNPIVIANQAINNCKPVMALKTVKKGGAAYRVPYTLTDDKSRVMALKWIYQIVSPLRPKTPKSLRLSNELMDAYEYTGKSVAKKLTLHKEAEANRAYINFKGTSSGKQKKKRKY